MSLKSSLKSAAIVCSCVIFGACAPGEIASPASPDGLDTNGDGIPDSKQANGINGTGPGSLQGQGSALTFSCNPDAHAPSTLRRLSRGEYENTLRSVLRVSTS